MRRAGGTTASADPLVGARPSIIFSISCTGHQAATCSKQVRKLGPWAAICYALALAHREAGRVRQDRLDTQTPAPGWDEALVIISPSRDKFWAELVGHDLPPWQRAGQHPSERRANQVVMRVLLRPATGHHVQHHPSEVSRGTRNRILVAPKSGTPKYIRATIVSGDWRSAVTL
jgi:hypothetical protein